MLSPHVKFGPTLDSAANSFPKDTQSVLWHSPLMPGGTLAPPPLAAGTPSFADPMLYAGDPTTRAPATTPNGHHLAPVAGVLLGGCNGFPLPALYARAPESAAYGSMLPANPDTGAPRTALNGCHLPGGPVSGAPPGECNGFPLPAALAVEQQWLQPATAVQSIEAAKRVARQRVDASLSGWLSDEPSLPALGSLTQDPLESPTQDPLEPSLRASPSDASDQAAEYGNPFGAAAGCGSYTAAFPAEGCQPADALQKPPGHCGSEMEGAHNSPPSDDRDSLAQPMHDSPASDQGLCGDSCAVPMSLEGADGSPRELFISPSTFLVSA